MKLKAFGRKNWRSPFWSLYETAKGKKIIFLEVFGGLCSRGRHLLHLPLLEGNTLNFKIEQGAISVPPELRYVLTGFSNTMCVQLLWISLKHIIKK